MKEILFIVITKNTINYKLKQGFWVRDKINTEALITEIKSADGDISNVTRRLNAFVSAKKLWTNNGLFIATLGNIFESNLTRYSDYKIESITVPNGSQHLKLCVTDPQVIVSVDTVYSQDNMFEKLYAYGMDGTKTGDFDMYWKIMDASDGMLSRAEVKRFNQILQKSLLDEIQIIELSQKAFYKRYPPKVNWLLSASAVF